MIKIYNIDKLSDIQIHKEVKMKKISKAKKVKNTIRRFWEVNPATRVFPDKTKYSRKQKHKKKEDD